MARKIKPRAALAEPDDLAVLQPNRTLPIGGKDVTVREIGFFESLRLHSDIAALVADLVDQAEDGNVGLARLHHVCARLPTATIALLAQACDQSAEWVQALTGAQGDLLLLTFWAVNADFFSAARAGGAGAEARGPGNDWPSVLATLIDHGHDWPWIERATARQLALFYRVAVQREHALRADRIEDVNAGFAGGRDVNAFVQSLRKTP